MGAHSELGASACERWVNCPGSVALAKRAPQPPSTVYAAEGSVAHEVAAAAVLGHPLPAVGTTVKQDGHEITIDEEMISHALDYAEYIKEIETQHGITRRWVEQMLEIKTIVGPEDLFGTTDYAGSAGYKSIHVVDYKYGKGKRVEIFNNRQLLFYALAVFRGLLSIVEQEVVDEIHLHVYQPRTTPENIAHWIISKATLVNFESELRAVAEKLICGTDNTLAPGEYCWYCPARVNCPAIKEKIKQEAGIELEQMANQLVLAEPGSLTDEQCATIFENIGFYQKYLETVKEHIFERAKTRKIPGLKLVQKRATAFWSDPEGVIEQLTPLLGTDIYTPAKLKSPNQISDVIKEKNRGKAKTDPSRIVVDTTPFFTKKSSGITIALESDKREEVSPLDAAKEFDVPAVTGKEI